MGFDNLENVLVTLIDWLKDMSLASEHLKSLVRWLGEAQKGLRRINMAVRNLKVFCSQNELLLCWIDTTLSHF